MLREVRFGRQKRYQQWFLSRHDLMGSGERLIPDMVRYICAVYHPPNAIIQSDILQRWAAVGWLLQCVKTEWVSTRAKFALFYDYMFFDNRVEAVMDLEPAILLMQHSLPKYAALTNTLLSFLFDLVEFYDPPGSASTGSGFSRSDMIKDNVRLALTCVLEKGVVSSLEFMFASEHISASVKERAKTLLGSLYKPSATPSPTLASRPTEAKTTPSPSLTSRPKEEKMNTAVLNPPVAPVPSLTPGPAPSVKETHPPQSSVPTPVKSPAKQKPAKQPTQTAPPPPVRRSPLARLQNPEEVTPSKVQQTLIEILDGLNYDDVTPDLAQALICVPGFCVSPVTRQVLLGSPSVDACWLLFDMMRTYRTKSGREHKLHYNALKHLFNELRKVTSSLGARLMCFLVVSSVAPLFRMPDSTFQVKIPKRLETTTGINMEMLEASSSTQFGELYSELIPQGQFH
eukprot:TRINITY_DN9319_c0_g1_i2.p1 TRINITY_DN9319_c0_g1~~TRINITY_DN9319_c0_g1_i2.p1  ORF type:complete len:457 (+),score=77.21 TRINITY_DN9319_c0_g1_i2:1088-2458(+)